MSDVVKVNDISEDLFILNKHTLDTLFRMENCTDCVALYVFYYKTAKWQKSNRIKATDLYVRKCLGWGADKLRKTKDILKSAGLINIIQVRKGNFISGWYIEVNYLVKFKSEQNITVIVENFSASSECDNFCDTNNTRNQQLPKPRSRKRKTNAYIINNNKMLKNNNYVLKNNNSSSEDELTVIQKENNNFNTEHNNFEEFWNLCPRKIDKQKTEMKYIKLIQDGIVTEETLVFKMQQYAEYVVSTEMLPKYVNTPISWLNKQKWLDDCKCDRYNISSNENNVSNFSASNTFMWE